jgi:hypothetical protein
MCIVYSAGMRVVASILAIAISTASLPARADAWESAMAAGAAAKERALDSNSPADWNEALDDFLQADALRETKESKYELAFAASHVKADDLACEAYERALELGLTGPARETARAFVAEHAPAMARVTVIGPAGATVHVSGRNRGVLPLKAPLVLFAGAVKLRVTTASGETSEHALELKAGETRSLDVSPPKPTPAKPAPPPPAPLRDEGGRTLAWTATIAGASLVVVGATFYVIAQKTIADRRIDLDTHCQTRLASDPDQCTQVYYGDDANVSRVQQAGDDILTFKAVRTASVISMSVGAIATAFGVGWLSAHPSSSTVVSGAPTHGGFALSLVTQF